MPGRLTPHDLREEAKRILEDAQKQADLLLEVAAGLEALQSVPGRRNLGLMESDSREIKISRGLSKGKRHPVVDAMAKAGLTPRQAAEYVGTTRDVLKQAWAHGSQFREI